MYLVLKLQGYRELRVPCKLYSGDSRNSKCLWFSIYHNFECIKNLNMLNFQRLYQQNSGQCFESVLETTFQLQMPRENSKKCEIFKVYYDLKREFFF